jgi:hypothetical protein
LSYSLVQAPAAAALAALSNVDFSDAVERTVLSAPRQIRDYVEPRALALLESPGNFAGL